jgi:flagellar hook-associated protein 2
LYASVEGTGITLSSIGITTSSNYEDKGKLVINEDKLKDALVNKPEEVSSLFTNNSDITYYEAINSTAASSIRSQRYKETGIAQRFSDIIQDVIRTNTDVGNHKGTLLEKAGIVGDRSEYNSLLSKEILQFDDDAYEMNKKLIAKENALYKKYAAMESALNKLNSQQSNLAQMLGQ